MDELVGVEILFFDEFYDGPLDGLARHNERELWFCIDRATEWLLERPRRYLAYELAQNELHYIHEVQLADSKTEGGPRELRALGASWDESDDVGFAPPDRDPIGWFRA